MRNDKITDWLMFSGSGLILLLTVISGASLREFSSTLTLVTFVLVTWRYLSTRPTMSFLARALSAAMSFNLLFSGISGMLLAQASKQEGYATPDNTAGLFLVILGRVIIIACCIWWHPMLNRFTPLRRKAN